MAAQSLLRYAHCCTAGDKGQAREHTGTQLEGLAAGKHGGAGQGQETELIPAQKQL